MGATRIDGAVIGDSFTSPADEQLKQRVSIVDNKKRLDIVASAVVKSNVRNSIDDVKTYWVS